MRNRTKLVLVGLAVAVFMSLAVGNAFAKRLEVSEQKFLAAWEPASPLTFTAAGHAIHCPVTLDGSFHSKTISKVSGQLIGYINQAIVANANCTNGHATALTETLPWHIRYVAFSALNGLPQIELVRIALIGARFRITTAEGTSCLAGTTQEHPAEGNINLEPATGRAESMEALREFKIPLGGGFICSLAGEGEFEGTAAVSSSATGRPAITVKLVS